MAAMCTPHWTQCCVWLQVDTEDTIENGQIAMEKRLEAGVADGAKKSAGKASEGGAKKKSAPVSKPGASKKRKTAGREYDPTEESVVMDIGDVILKQDNSENSIRRLLDSSLPKMKKKNKLCKVEAPGKECAIFTIDVSPLSASQACEFCALELCMRCAHHA